MRTKPDVGTVVGTSDETHWGQAILSPGAYGVVELECDDAKTKGIHLLSSLSEKFINPPKNIDEIETFVRDLISPDMKTLILLVPVRNIVHIVVGGSGTVYVKRDNTISCLIQNEGALTGEMKVGDTLILSSKTMSKAVSRETLVGIFDHLPARDVAEKLTLLLHEAQNTVGSSALIFRVVEVVPQKEIQKSFRGLPVKISIIPFLLFALFSFSVILGIVKKTRDGQSHEAQNAVVQATHVFEEGVALLDLNPVKGRERLNQAKEILEPFAKEKSVVELYNRVLDNLTLAMHNVKSEPELFFDASLIKSGGNIEDFSLFEDVFGFFDGVNRSVYTLSASTKKNSIVGGGEAVEGGKYISLYGDKAYIFTQNGITQVRISDKKTMTSIIQKADIWGTITSFVAYAGNVYLLDTEKSRIWKYVATEKSFSEIREYLNPDSLPDFTKATGMAIDGSVWIGTSDGKILRFTQGKEQTFLPQGVEPPLGQFLVVFTSDVSKNLYVLDNGSKRVVVLDKDGIYLAQYVWEGNWSPSDLAVSEKEKKIFLLIEGKVYFLELK